MAERKKEKSFEDAMERLEEIVNMLEGGEHPLDESLSLFSEGINLVKFCNSKIENVEKSVKKLVNENGELVEKDFTVDGKNEA